VGDGNDDSADDFTRNEIRRRTAFDIDPTHLNGGKQMAAA
jgi:hypothetical protein